MEDWSPFAGPGDSQGPRCDEVVAMMREVRRRIVAPSSRIGVLSVLLICLYSICQPSTLAEYLQCQIRQALEVCSKYEGHWELLCTVHRCVLPNSPCSTPTFCIIRVNVRENTRSATSICDPILSVCMPVLRLAFLCCPLPMVCMRWMLSCGVCMHRVWMAVCGFV